MTKPNNIIESTPAAPELGEILLYTTEDGNSRVECRLEGDTLWLTQALLAELFQKDIRTINEHLQNIYEDNELEPQATIRKFRIVRREGSRNVSRTIDHYNLDAILAVGYRVRSRRGVQFRQWATERLSEYLTKGFTMDDERLKNPPVRVNGEPHALRRISRQPAKGFVAPAAPYASGHFNAGSSASTSSRSGMGRVPASTASISS